MVSAYSSFSQKMDDSSLNSFSKANYVWTKLYILKKQIIIFNSVKYLPWPTFTFLCATNVIANGEGIPVVQSRIAHVKFDYTISVVYEPPSLHVHVLNKECIKPLVVRYVCLLYTSRCV